LVFLGIQLPFIDGIFPPVCLRRGLDVCCSLSFVKEPLSWSVLSWPQSPKPPEFPESSIPLSRFGRRLWARFFPHLFCPHRLFDHLLGACFGTRTQCCRIALGSQAGHTCTICRPANWALVCQPEWRMENQFRPNICTLPINMGTQNPRIPRGGPLTL